MSQNSDGSEIHNNVFTGPTVIGGSQTVVGVTPVSTRRRVSTLSQVWAAFVLTWSLCPMAVWWTQSSPGGDLIPGVTTLVQTATPYVCLAGGVAVLLDVLGYFLYRHWTVATRAITHPVTWKLRLLAVAVGGLSLAAAMFTADG